MHLMNIAKRVLFHMNKYWDQPFIVWYSVTQKIYSPENFAQAININGYGKCLKAIMNSKSATDPCRARHDCPPHPYYMFHFSWEYVICSLTCYLNMKDSSYSQTGKDALNWHQEETITTCRCSNKWPEYHEPSSFIQFQCHVWTILQFFTFCVSKKWLQ